jgi:hypothetical protein
MIALPPKNLLLAALFVAGALGLAILSIRHSERSATPGARPQRHVPAAPVSTFESTRALFTLSAIPGRGTDTNSPHPFFTTYFQPAPQPPKTTRRVEVSYQGFFQTPEGERHAYVLADTNLIVVPTGGRILGNLSVTTIDRPSVTLAIGDTQSTLLPFRAKTNVVVTFE